MEVICEAFMGKWGKVPLLETYRQMAIRQQKLKDWEACRWWAERGLALYGNNGAREEAVEDLLKALAGYSAVVERLVPVLEAIAVATVRDVLPSAERLEVLGEMNEDWAWTLRIQRVLDANGTVVFDLSTGAEAEVEDLIHEVGVDYLDRLLEITGEDFVGLHLLDAWQPK